MAAITIRGGTEIFCKDWGSKGARPLFFHHSWPLSADDYWDSQIMFFLVPGYRVIAHDCRGHGRSTKTALGHDMDTYAEDDLMLDREMLQDVSKRAGGRRS